MCTLYVMVGIPGSGKTTWANEFLNCRNNCLYISRDTIRMKMLKPDEDYFKHEDDVFKEFCNEITKDLKFGYDVIADATHLSINSRKKLLNGLRRAGMQDCDYSVIFVYLNTNRQICIQRDNTRNGRAHVGASVIGRMDTQLIPPSIDEYPNAKAVWTIGV